MMNIYSNLMVKENKKSLTREEVLSSFQNTDQKTFAR